MKTESGKIDGDYEVAGQLQLDGMIGGNVTVKDGALLQLNGMVVGSLVIETGGTAIVRGTVGGGAINKGGELEVYGVVHGGINGPAHIDANAVIE